MGIKSNLWEMFSAFKAAAANILHTVLTNEKIIAEEDEEMREFLLCEECSWSACVSNTYHRSRMSCGSVG